MLPGDLQGSPDESFSINNTLIFIDEGFLSKLSKYFGEDNVKTILYTYYEKKRDTNFSRSNELVKSVHKYVKLTKEDFLNFALKKE